VKYNWTRLGTDNFLGLEMSQGHWCFSSGQASAALILMGDWRASVRCANH
jgi:hypothetical protein